MQNKPNTVNHKSNLQYNNLCSTEKEHIHRQHINLTIEGTYRHINLRIMEKCQRIVSLEPKIY
jgi:hypothetical protein